MFFPAQPDALSPLNEYTKPYRPPTPKLTKNIFDAIPMSITGFGMSKDIVPTIFDLSMIRNQFGEPLVLEDD